MRRRHVPLRQKRKKAGWKETLCKKAASFELAHKSFDRVGQQWYNERNRSAIVGVPLTTGGAESQNAEERGD